MTRLIFDTLSLLFFGLLLGAWLHARFGKPTVEGRWWDLALGLVILTRPSPWSAAASRVIP